MLDKKKRMNDLLDFYEALLTQKQQNILNDYYREDLSLTEIAEIQNTSKAAVFDLIKRSEMHLESYEEKLQLLVHYQKRMRIYQSLLDLNDKRITDYINQCIDTE